MTYRHSWSYQNGFIRFFAILSITLPMNHFYMPIAYMMHENFTKIRIMFILLKNTIFFLEIKTTPPINSIFTTLICFFFSIFRFSLNTLVRYPHSFDKVNKINFKKNENLLFTCGNDGCFKSWILTENKPQG